MLMVSKGNIETKGNNGSFIFLYFLTHVLAFDCFFTLKMHSNRYMVSIVGVGFTFTAYIAILSLPMWGPGACCEEVGAHFVCAYVMGTIVG